MMQRAKLGTERRRREGGMRRFEESMGVFWIRAYMGLDDARYLS